MRIGKSICAVASIVGIVLGYVLWGAAPNPDITLDRLGGLSPDQVIARLGRPSYDPRQPDRFGKRIWPPGGSRRMMPVH